MIGLATIGQAPRDDVTPSMFGDPRAVNILQSGALDDCLMSDIENLKPGEGEHPLVTRLADGSEVVIAKERVTPLLERAVKRLAGDGATVVCVLCTGEFNLIGVDVPVVYPDRLLAGVVNSLLDSGTLGVVIPHSGQTASMREKWRCSGRRVAIEVVSPYSGAGKSDEWAARLAAEECDLIVLDCMGFNMEMKRAAQSASGVPVVLANQLVGSVLVSMTSNDQAL